MRDPVRTKQKLKVLSSKCLEDGVLTCKLKRARNRNGDPRCLLQLEQLEEEIS